MSRAAIEISGVAAAPVGPVVAVRDLSVSYRDDRGAIPVLRGVDLDIARGETLALVGESGSGKSTLARALVRLLPRTGRVVSGTIAIEGQDVLALNAAGLRALRGARVGFVFQDPDVYLNPVFPVGRQIADVIVLHRGVAPAEARRQAEAQLTRVDIRDAARVMHAYPHELSGGMRQRVLMALATACQPALLIADEPTTALDVLVQRQVLATLARLRQETGMAVMLVTHDLGVVAENADRVAVMYGGSIVEVQAVRELFRAPRHPYTRALIAAAGPAGRRFATLPGSPPDLRRLPPGCAIAPRCERVQERCHATAPALQAGHSCWNPLP